MNDEREKAYLAKLKSMSGVNEFSRSCSVCGWTSSEGWGVGLRKDWSTGIWYCLDHYPIATETKR